MSVLFILGLLLSAVIGLSLGLIGGGGSIVTVPVLVYVLGVEVHAAIGMSLAVVGATSLVGSFLHYRRGVVRLNAKRKLLTTLLENTRVSLTVRNFWLLRPMFGKSGNVSAFRNRMSESFCV